MAQHENNFKVLIAGGSITGLTLAHTLDRAGVDFVVLEGHEEIAPQVGASIAVFPNGIRILDQLGIWNDINDVIEPVQRSNFRDSEGKSFLKFGSGRMLQTVLEGLYRNVKDKSKVLTGHRVLDIKQSEQGVEVTTKNSKPFKGDIVIDADGMHSTVRHLMQKTAGKVQPGYIPERDKTGMFSEYCCIFVISKPTGDIKGGYVDIILCENYSFLIVTGVGGCLYWLLFIKMDKKYYEPNIPTFTEEDCEQMARKYFKAKVAETLAFEDCWNNRIASTLTALQEHFLSRWHFGRMISMGDSAHKTFQANENSMTMAPNFGQGGCCCIESVAMFSNILNCALSKEKSGKISSEKITVVFQEYQEKRMARAQRFFNVSGKTTRLPLIRT
ncbi:hypothetical protein RUND412_010322 [Rhizina undulata]